MLLFNKRITKALISLRGCAGWSPPVLFANSFFRVGVHMMNAFGLTMYGFKMMYYCYLIRDTLQGTYEPRHEISNNVVCATSKASDQPAHMRSLLRAFASRLNIL